MYNQSLKHLLLSAFPIFLCEKRSLEGGSLAGLALARPRQPEQVVTLK